MKGVMSCLFPVSEKKSEQKKHPEALVEAVVEEDLKKKTGRCCILDQLCCQGNFLMIAA